MKGIKNISSKDRRTYKIIIILFITICILMGIICVGYYRRVQDTVKSESSGYIQEISKQMSTNVNKNIKDNFSVLGTIATVIKNNDKGTFEQMKSVVQEQRVYWNYQKIMLIDENGVAYDETGKTVLLSNDEYLQEAIVERKSSMSASQVIDGTECIIFAIPIDNITIGGTKMLALAASYDLSTFDKILSMTAFDGKGYAHIIRKDGTVVIRSSSENVLQMGYNILTSISNAEINDGQTYAELKRQIENGQSGQIDFTMNGVREYMAYTPLESKEWCLLTFVPVSVVNEKSELLLKITFLLCGFITLTFAVMVVILMTSFYNNKKKLENIAYVDPVTGGNTISYFYELAEAILEKPQRSQYALIYTNIEKFKVLNEQFGRNSCDEILRSIKNGIGVGLSENECMGRLFADNFCILVEYTDEASIVERFDSWYKACANYMDQRGASWLPLIIEFGVYVIGNDTMPFPHMVDRAKLALSETTRELRGKLRYAIYDEQIRRMLFREKHIEDMMEDALLNGEFEVYLQPKYLTQNEKIGGAEALVRWANPREGMIYPDEFIGLFEKNGFIIQLDLWVFEEVCKTIRRWIESGEEPVKVSVNCSRMHLKNPLFLNQYCKIADKYFIPPNLIEIELTENTVFEDVEQLTHIIERIHEAGFGCSMDDFGSGYSSLNLIQDIPVDTLKLDKIFFKNTSRDLARTESVVGSIITMSKALSMATVAEGVEERDQVDMLKRLNCDYIQGYFFAKPMPIPQFEKIAFGENKKVMENKIKEGDNDEKG